MYKTIHLVLFIFLSCASLAGGEDRLVKIRDAHTGALIAAEINLYVVDETKLSKQHWQLIRSGQWNENNVPLTSPAVTLTVEGTLDIGSIKDFKNQWQLIRIEAKNHQSISTYIEPNQHISLETVWLRPQQIGKRTQLNFDCQSSVVCGYVYDIDTLKPLSEVRIKYASQNIYSDKTGFFRLEKSTLSGEIEWSLPGYKKHVIEMTSVDSTLFTIIDLTRGEGVNKQNLRHPLEQMYQNGVPHQWLIDKLSHSEMSPEQDVSKSELSIRERGSGAVFSIPPQSVRVGFAEDGGYCCGSNCQISEVFDLEFYVQRGLDNEWIASWEQDSLKAGSVPFRSYAAWHVLNSPYSGYDICAGPCCQAFEASGYASSIAAAKASNGIMLELNGAIARSEYSAENNSWNDPDDGLNCTNTDLSCGDGYVGSPSTGWACLYDQSEGRGCFGHGRGMSQWGSQYRALSEDNWAQIVDHYYNNNNQPLGMRGQYATTPLRIDNVSTSTTEIQVNQQLTISYDLMNGLPQNSAFGFVLLGASLVNPTESFSDPSNDSSFVIEDNGKVTLNRIFKVPKDTSEGLYDLLVAIWLDTDSDGLISSTDWALDTLRIEKGIHVVSDQSDVIFADGFE